MMEQELKAFERSLDRAIDTIMQTAVGDAAAEAISEAVQTEVYAVYTPEVYERRGEHGGLADTSAMNYAPYIYDPATKTLIVENRNRDDDTGRLVAPVVESGQGYRYDFPYNGIPRPFHDVAERRMMEKGIFERTLTENLKFFGFDVTE